MSTGPRSEKSGVLRKRGSPACFEQVGANPLCSRHLPAPPGQDSEAIAPGDDRPEIMQ